LDVHALGWIGLATIVLVLITVDIVGHVRKPHVPSMKESVWWSVGYIVLALLFGVIVWAVYGSTYAGEYYAGYITEKSLSLDNLFVFIIIMAKFGVPEKYQQTALMVGIVIALILRGIFIALGATLINQFSFMFYLFGAFLIYTAIKLGKEGLEDDDDDEFEENGLLKFVERRFSATTSWEFGTRLFGRVDGKKVATPMLITILALGTTDLMFALDSIPAIFGLTKEPFIVLTANIFALMGLRQLYFLIGGLLERLVYLSLGLSVLLAFIGVKLILHALHENQLSFINGGQPLHVPVISTGVSLGAIVLILGVTTVLSLLKTGRENAAA